VTAPLELRLLFSDADRPRQRCLGTRQLDFGLEHPQPLHTGRVALVMSRDKLDIGLVENDASRLVVVGHGRTDRLDQVGRRDGAVDGVGVGFCSAAHGRCRQDVGRPRRRVAWPRLAFLLDALAVKVDGVGDKGMDEVHGPLGLTQC